MRLKLYGRTYCHLCEVMAGALEKLRAELPFSVEVLDVDADPELEARYGELVPVLTDEAGREICHYHLDEHALRQALAAPPRAGAPMR